MKATARNKHLLSQ